MSENEVYNLPEPECTLKDCIICKLSPETVEMLMEGE